MWATLALMSAMNGMPAQAGQLELKNQRVTYGILGQERKDTTYLPGDMVVLAFDVEGLTPGADGLLRYSMSVELTDKNGKQQFKKDPQETMTVNALGGTRRPEFALTNIGTDTMPGEYKMIVVVTDLGAKEKPSVKAERPFEVKQPQFGIVRPGFTYNDLNGQSSGEITAPPLAIPGQNLQINFAVVGFELKGDTQEPNIAVKMEIFDEKNDPVLKKPFTGSGTNLEEGFKKLKVMPLFFPIQVNRSGKFKIVLTATDKNTNKTATQTLDLKVIETN